MAGDGIGKEVMPEGIRVVDAAAVRHGIRLQWDELELLRKAWTHDARRLEGADRRP
jgi:isocitrate/isopropylmalate dehydrogenase